MKPSAPICCSWPIIKLPDIVCFATKNRSFRQTQTLKLVSVVECGAAATSKSESPCRWMVWLGWSL